MKRFISLLLIAVLVLACFTACGKKKDNVSDDPNGMIEDTTKPTTTTVPSTREPVTENSQPLPSESLGNNSTIGSDSGMGDMEDGTDGIPDSEDSTSSTVEGAGRNRRARPLFR